MDVNVARGLKRRTPVGQLSRSGEPPDRPCRARCSRGAAGQPAPAHLHDVSELRDHAVEELREDSRRPELLLGGGSDGCRPVRRRRSRARSNH